LKRNNIAYLLTSIQTLILSSISLISAQQISIDRIELMPGEPNPYQMRDWKKVATGYDSLIFDLEATGTFLPLTWTDNNSINYPEHGRFGIDSYVGVPVQKSAEAINVLPAVLSATLVGIDKTNQHGYNWVEMCEEFFNNRPEENVYLNNFITASGNDWWYDTMPNVFFYQLYQFYPNQGDFAYQFTTVADRWFEAIEHMGGSTTPWKKPYMNYRAWALSTMTSMTSGVRQPEAAGALAWLMYMAFSETGEEKYRIGAEWACEYLNSLSTNPLYEMQLPYGAYIAARMNAELNASFNIEKLVDWCFTTEGNVRNWGMTLGNWGGYDCYGLLGEAVNEGYAFTMNGFEQIGALVPMVRYDERFTRAIGKWVLHCANASRLFYSNFLPATNQDSESWAFEYDPSGYIAYESMRENQPFSGISPFATGDAKKGGWAATNLGLYGSSHVGILGAIIDTTDVSKILLLDTRATDYFADSGYPTYIIYNPYSKDTTITLQLDQNNYDIYDAASNTFLKSGVSGNTTLGIEADNALLVVLIPSGAEISYKLNQMLVNEIIADYNAGETVDNYPPRIKSLAPDHETVLSGGNVILYTTTNDPDDDVLAYIWLCEEGTVSGEGTQMTWTAPVEAGDYTITCIADDQNGARDSATVIIAVIDNQNPIIDQMIAEPPEIATGGISELLCKAIDPDGDSLIYSWETYFGQVSGTDSIVNWQGPDEPGYYFVTCNISDQRGGWDKDSIGIVNGNLVGYYSFTGNTLDSSGMDNHGQLIDALLTEDRFGLPNGAYHFDGIDDMIRVSNHPTLNFQNQITVAFWMRVEAFFDREAYPISHGNWENRWKISITNEGIRWTVKTTDGIKDLDSKKKLALNEYTHVVCVYDGSRYEIYLNGILDNSSTFSGKILHTSIDLTIGQVLPNNSNYNFEGVLDHIMIFNRALESAEIEELYQQTTTLEKYSLPVVPQTTRLSQNYPNPFNPSTNIRYQLSEQSTVEIRIYDINGRQIETLEKARKMPGYHSINWETNQNASGIYFIVLNVGNRLYTRKCVKLK